LKVQSFFYALIFNVLQLKTETKNRPLEKLLIFYFLLLTCLINLKPIAKNQLLENASFRLLTGLRPLQKDFDQKGISQGRVFCGRRPPNNTDEAEPRPSRSNTAGKEPLCQGLKINQKSQRRKAGKSKLHILTKDFWGEALPRSDY
jgi:hypothetical protein